MDSFVIGDTTYPVVITRKPIKHLYVRFKDDSTLRVNAPLRMSEEAIRRFLETKAPLLESRISGRAVKAMAPEGMAHWFGSLKPIAYTTGKQPFSDDVALWIPMGSELFAMLERLYKQEVVSEAKGFWEIWKKRLPEGVLEGWTLSSTDTKSLYGSCSKKTKTIRLSSVLGRLDKIHLETILVHELTHLFVAGHGKAFYDILLSFLPDYRKRHRALVAAHRKIEV